MCELSRTLAEMPDFPSMTGREFNRLIKRAPLSYSVARRGGGSHTTWVSANGYPVIHTAFHDNQQLSPGLVRKILVKDIGLQVEEALAIL
jgi:predicted RNA binding protein YcfA (HicA-like mRNA interferase family)